MTARTRFVLRYGEIFLKGRNRPFFEHRLVQNVERVLLSLDATVERIHGRLIVTVAADQANTATARLGHAFGLTSFSPVIPTEPTMESLTAAALAETRQALKTWAGPNPPRFKVETRRPDKSFPLQSPEVSRQIGGAVAGALALPVDLTTPELRVEVEIGRQLSFVTTRRYAGAGGLPVGTAGPVVLLLSGGIDSPVAGWLLLKRGCTLRPITFESPPYTGPEARDKVLDLCRLLARWGGDTALRVVRFTEAQQAIQRQCPPRLAVVLYRRMMLRVAEATARQEGARALGTGESIGQVASQTLENIDVIAQVTTRPVLRPLITYDKAETIALAERIGTYPISIRPHVDCCSLFVPEHPETHAQPAEVEEAEAALSVDELTRDLTSAAELIPVPADWS